MMNMFEVGERLKDFSKDQLVKEMQAPSGLAPQFMVLSELQRRMRMEQAMKSDGQGAPQTTVAEDAVAAAGVPQGGIADMARALAPKTDMTQNTGVAPVPAMAEGGRVRGDAMAEFEEYLDSLGPAQRRLEEARLAQERLRASRALTAPAETGGLSDIPTTLEPVRRGAITGGLPRGPRGFSPLSFDNPLAAERAAAEQVSIPLNAIEQMYLQHDRSGQSRRAAPSTPLVAERPRRYIPPTIGATELNTPAILNALSMTPVVSEDTSLDYGPPRRPTAPLTPLDYGPPRRTAPLTPLEYGPPRRRPPAEPAAVDNPMLRFEENFDYQGAPARAPSLPAVSPEGLQETIDAGRPPVNPMLEFQEDFDYQGAPTFGPGRDTGTPLTTDTPNLLPPTTTSTTAPDKKTTAPAGAGGPGAGGALPEFDRMLEQDKWLSLARFGMALMSSQAPTFGQALGEAGTVGLDALGKARADYLERKQTADLMALRRAAAAGQGKSGGLTISNLISIRDDLVTQIDGIKQSVAIGQPLPDSALKEVKRLTQTLAGIDQVLGLNTFGAIGAATSGSGAPELTRLPSLGG